MSINKYYMKTVCIFMVALAITGCSNGKAGTEPVADKPAVIKKRNDIGRKMAESVAGELLVQFDKDVSATEAEKLIASSGDEIKQKIIGSEGLYLVTLASGISAEDALKRYERLREVEYAQPNMIMRKF